MITIPNLPVLLFYNLNAFNETLNILKVHWLEKKAIIKWERGEAGLNVQTSFFMFKN